MRCCAKKDNTIGTSPCSLRTSLDGVEKFEIVSPGDVELVQVQILFRHGSRTPFTFTSGLTEATYDRAIGLDLPETKVPVQVVNIISGKPAGASPMERDFRELRLKGGCRAAVLTTVGQKEMLTLGRKIRATYLEPLNITSYSPDIVRIRSTHIERTIKSLRCVLVGIFGRIDLTKNGPLKLPVKDIWDEDIFPNKLSCPSLRLAVNMTLANLDTIPDYHSDKRKMLEALGQPNGHLDFSCLKDDASSRVAHGKPYPAVLEPFKEMIEKRSAQVLRAVTTGRIEGSPPRDDVLMMSIGRLLHSLLAQMEDVVAGVVKPRMYLYAGHDTTLIPILEVLNMSHFRWPPFGASLVLELYRSRDTTVTTKYYVRVIYCWSELVLPCYPNPLIPFPIFRKIFSRYAVSPSEFRRMCGIKPADLRV